MWIGRSKNPQFGSLFIWSSSRSKLIAVYSKIAETYSPARPWLWLAPNSRQPTSPSLVIPREIPWNFLTILWRAAWCALLLLVRPSTTREANLSCPYCCCWVLRTVKYGLCLTWLDQRRKRMAKGCGRRGSGQPLTKAGCHFVRPKIYIRNRMKNCGRNTNSFQLLSLCALFFPLDFLPFGPS